MDQHATRLALDDEVRPVIRATGETTFALTDAAVAVGDRRLLWQDGSYNHVGLHTFLGRWMYHDQALADLLIPALWGGLGVFVVGLLVAVPKDLARTRARR